MKTIHSVNEVTAVSDGVTAISRKTIEWMVFYQHILSDLALHDVDYLHLHEIAERTNNSGA